MENEEVKGKEQYIQQWNVSKCVSECILTCVCCVSVADERNVGSLAGGNTAGEPNTDTPHGGLFEGYFKLFHYFYYFYRF